MPKIKILCTYHKPSSLISDNIFVPIHAGRAVESAKNKDGSNDKNDFEWLNKNCIGDNTGHNISDKNLNYNEITAQFWAYENYDKLENPDYIGLMHYRRHLSFNKNTYNENKDGYIVSKRLSRSYKKKFLNKKNIINYASNYDIITVKPWDVQKYNYTNVYEQYKMQYPTLHIEDLDKAIEILLQKYPEYSEAAKSYYNNPLGYYTNIFIMKKEIFFEYSKWLFSILFELENQIPQYENINEKRAIAHISERLFGVYIAYQKSTNNYKILELQRTFILDTELISHKIKNFLLTIGNEKNHKVWTILGIKMKFKTRSNAVAPERE